MSSAATSATIANDRDYDPTPPANPRAAAQSPGGASVRELRNRALRYGVASLGDAELVELLLGRGAQERAGSLLSAMHLETGRLAGLARATPRSLLSITSLSAAEATRVCSAFELGRRALAHQGDERRGKTPMSAAAVARWAEPRLVHLDHEEVWVLCLDGRGSLLCARQVGRGGVHGCALLARDVLVPIVREAASAFVLVHNHPSGDPTPSREDLDMTRALAAAADVICVALLDHVVVARGGHRSNFEMGFFDRS